MHHVVMGLVGGVLLGTAAALLLAGGRAVGILATRAIQTSRATDPAQIPQADFERASALRSSSPASDGCSEPLSHVHRGNLVGVRFRTLALILLHRCRSVRRGKQLHGNL